MAQNLFGLPLVRPQGIQARREVRDGETLFQVFRPRRVLLCV